MKYVKRLSVRLALAVCLSLCLCLSAFASDGGSGGADISAVTNALTSGISGLVPTILTAAGALAAAGLAIFGAKFAVRAGIQMFKRVTGG